MWRISAPLWAWAISSALLGLGFTFFSGAVEAWLVDALTVHRLLARRRQPRSGARQGRDCRRRRDAGRIGRRRRDRAGDESRRALHDSRRSCWSAVVRLRLRADARHRASRRTAANGRVEEVKSVLRSSIAHGLGNPPVRWIMLAAPFTGGVDATRSTRCSPTCCELYGDERAYGVAGLAAAIVAGAQIAGGLLVPYVGRLSPAARRCCSAARRSAPSCRHRVHPALLGGRHAARLLGPDVFRDHARAPVIPERPDRPRASARRCCRSTRCWHRAARSSCSPSSARQPTSGATRPRILAARSCRR